VTTLASAAPRIAATERPTDTPAARRSHDQHPTQAHHTQAHHDRRRHPAGSDEYSQSVGAGGPLLLQDHYLIQKMTQSNRERVLDRVVHANGGGVLRVFTATEDVSQFTKAAVFAQRTETETETLAQFATAAGEQGAADTQRDPRGFSVKLHPSEGTWDKVGSNTPVFLVRDPAAPTRRIRRMTTSSRPARWSASS
jgi:catalase